ncbi:Calreticulin/calnexin [Blyttiomyces helicus]|uniref:Calreticulin/calnexin n=1 Tax=Blyttiomyces helicus TaxID=388810 RepID=A0A4V1IRY6_9FUNG|nr:Calreticulin/calnexin [Blyttiomyces helicus]|eukprot:RKO91687.1 Calreticulin/calnexin [Blyttiomyces helicus]
MRIRHAFPLLCFVFASGAFAEDPVDAESKTEAKPLPEFKPTTIKGPFVEQFVSGWDKRWVASSQKKEVDGVEDDELLRYRGEWAVEAPTVFPSIEGDKGLVVKTAAAHHAIAARFDAPVDPKGKTFVAQYEVKFENGLECGGAYIKLLTHNDLFEARKFDDKTPYTIMFGPDKCGSTNKVHFIFRHKNPVTGEFEEKHLKTPPAAKISKTTNLYTLIVRPDQTFDILINSEKAKSGSLLEDFSPAVNPPKEIDDPEDKKPEDWVDQAKIVDPEAKKPDDWDEEAPMEILDEEASQPADWLADEPSSIADPDSEKPDDWDEEEDGEWIAPTISNPKCDKVSGCGEWTRPMKRNPAYKGKWTAPLIDNPAYKGVWAPRKIPNPAYFEDLTPSSFSPIGAVGIELWTMQNGMMFDNLYVGHSEADAKKFAQETYAIKAASEKAQEDAAKPPKPVSS